MTREKKTGWMVGDGKYSYEADAAIFYTLVKRICLADGATLGDLSPEELCQLIMIALHS